jgi:EpsI family protein
MAMSESRAASHLVAASTGGWSMPAFWVPLALYVIGAFVYWSELQVLMRRWADTEGYQHGWLVAAIVPILIWAQRYRVVPAAASRRDRLFAASGLLLIALGFAIAHGAGINLLLFLTFPAADLLASWLVLGRAAVLALAFPIGYFLFAIPVWAVIRPVLQWLTIKASTILVTVFGVNAFIEGSFVTLPAGKFEIAEGCSGLHFFLVAFAISTLLAFVERLSVRRTLIVVATGLALAIVANWIRVSAIIVIGNATDMRSSLLENHYAFGWWVYAAALLPLFFISRRIAGTGALPAEPTRTVATVKASVGAVAAVILALGAGPMWVRAVGAWNGSSMRSVVLPLVPGWEGPSVPQVDWQPQFPGAAEEKRAAYSRAEATVDVFVALYDRQEPDRKLIGARSSIDGARWRVMDAVQLTVAGQSPATVAEHVVADDSGGARVIWYWYEVRGVRVLRPLQVQLRLAASAFGLSGDSAIVGLSARCLPSCDTARRALSEIYAAGIGRVATASSADGGARQ